MHRLYRSLGSTSSGSFLVENTHMTSCNTIAASVLEALPHLPQPDWHLLYPKPSSHYQTCAQLENKIVELTKSLGHSQNIIKARELMGEHRDAVVQNVYLLKQNESLKAKETKKKADRTKLTSNGLGRHLTADEFIDMVKEQDEEKRKKADGKKKKQEAWSRAKGTKAALEEIWKRMQANHNNAVTEWELECTRLLEAGSQKKTCQGSPQDQRSHRSRLGSQA